MRPGCGGQRPRLVGQVGGRVRHLAQEDLPDLRPVAVDRRDQDVAGQIAGQLDDELGQIGLHRGDPGRGQRVVEADLSGDHRLHLDDLVDAAVDARGADKVDHDPVGLGRIVGPVHLAAGRGDRSLELLQVAVQMP